MMMEVMMKNEEKKVMLGFTPHPGQQRIIQELISKYLQYPITQQKSYFILNIGRQWGKSLMVCNYLLWVAINNHKQDCLYITPTFKLAKKIFREFSEAVEGAPVVKSLNKTDLLIEFVNGSIVRFGSGENPMAWRGFTLSLLVIDEAAFCQQALWTVLEPTLRVKGRMCIMISTPNGRNWFWSMYQRAATGTPNWYAFNAPSWESPFINKAEIDEIKVHSELQWRIEYNAEFVDDDTAVFRNITECIDDCTREHPVPEDIIYMGLDLGRKNDYTVATIINQKNEVLDVLRIRQQDWTTILNQIQEFYHRWKPVSGIAEVNYNDRVIEELINERGCKNLKTIYTSSSSKSEIIQNLVLLFDKKLVKLPEPTVGRATGAIVNELRQYTYRYNPETGRMSYGAPKGLHDDCVMSLAFAFWSAKSSKKSSGNPFLWEKL